MSRNSEGSLHMDSTLEDGAWLDSFDKLLEPRPVLRELNILKKEVHASFNRDSSVENSINSKANESDLLKTTQISLNLEDKARKTSSISTPEVHRGFKVDPFKCSLSPIGAWRLLYFDKGKNAVNDRELCVVNEDKSYVKCTPVKPTITVVDYDEPDDPTAPKDHDVASTLGKKLKRTRVGIRATNSRHVCFEPVVENSLGKTLTKPSLDHTNQKHKEITEQRIPSLTLQPGKWRKSFSVWRRKQVEKRSSSLINRQSGNRNTSVEYIGFVGTAAGNRKSIYLKKEFESRVVDATPVTDDVWEEKVLERCNQQTPLPFEELYSANKMPYCVKIGEGAYGEVFLNATSKRKMTDASSTVMKVIPIEGKIEVNGEKQKTYEQVLTEVVISMELANLRKDIVNMTNGFVNVKKVACVKGEYPQHLKKLWESFDEEKGSENDHPDIFDATQIYIVLELEFCGRDLESFQFQNAEQAYFALLQVILTLAVAEQAYQFEHRDLHWGNILILNTNMKELKFTLDNQAYIVPTKGVRATLIDYTLSRMTFDNCCHYNDISCDEELFTATGDYQFDIYRMMRDILSNNWETFEPRTNIFWISYVITKMVDGVQYKNKRTKIHTTYYSKLENLFEIVLNFKGAIECAKYLMNSD
ncbi:PREDICTED: putative serine/threonine-protein kinase haspin homolog [Rhagoletis zephyria]|uniref:putative serine/threonine-protein kinase haspin homolog n=1 Tax=Rhagoletis zephyria TaxID=28612 RepID=UPI00081173E5|nr:PREDICTED: putative serine/threonine-protein kinase haspin homolog [Rhagoletis zephyria]XP_036321027.1 putative serine/threonine-protein kinase haspin homolog [Rhagoletis pomonella]